MLTAVTILSLALVVPSLPTLAPANGAAQVGAFGRPLLEASTASFALDGASAQPAARRRSRTPIVLGAVAGAAVGIGFGTYVAHSLCEGECDGKHNATVLGIAGGLGAGAGATVGLAIRALTDRSPAPARAPARVTAVPIVSPTTRGALVSMRF